VYGYDNHANNNLSLPMEAAVSPEFDNPSVLSYSPADNATGVAVNANLVIEFSEQMDVSAVTTVTLKNVGGATIETFNSSTDGIWTNGDLTRDTWTVTPASDLVNSANLCVQYSGFKDLAGNAAPSVADDTTWSFDVVA
jgi:hypothetical protein